MQAALTGIAAHFSQHKRDWRRAFHRGLSDRGHLIVFSGKTSYFPTVERSSLVANGAHTLQQGRSYTQVNQLSGSHRNGILRQCLGYAAFGPSFRYAQALILPRRRAGTCWNPHFGTIPLPMAKYSPQLSIRYRRYNSTSMQLLGFSSVYQKQRSGLIRSQFRPFTRKRRIFSRRSAGVSPILKLLRCTISMVHGLGNRRLLEGYLRGVFTCTTEI